MHCSTLGMKGFRVGRFISHDVSSPIPFFVPLVDLCCNQSRGGEGKSGYAAFSLGKLSISEGQCLCFGCEGKCSRAGGIGNMGIIQACEGKCLCEGEYWPLRDNKGAVKGIFSICEGYSM